jgi:hypothetical protein
LSEDGFSAKTAHTLTTTDEDVTGLDSLDDLAGMEFAATPGQSALDDLAQIMLDEESVGGESSSWIEPDYTSLSEMILQFSNNLDSVIQAEQMQAEQNFDAFISEYAGFGGLDAGDSAGDLAGSLLQWAQSNMPVGSDIQTGAAYSSTGSSSGPSIEQLAADIANVPMPEEHDPVHA